MGQDRQDTEIDIRAGAVQLGGTLTVPKTNRGLVVFVHGSGSSRHSPRNRHVAGRLNAAGLGTLLFDLLTGEEAEVRANVFDIDLLADRLHTATNWVRREAEVDAALGYFGASTGAAAALVAAARAPNEVSALVSRGGRPDLAGSLLTAVTTPTLLIVGGRDEVVLDLNRQAQMQLAGESRLEVVPGATHLFEEPGALDQVAILAGDWFLEHLASGPR